MLVNIHSYLRYGILATLILTIILSGIGFLGNKPFDKNTKLIGTINTILAHTQLLVGLSLYFTSPMVQFNSLTMKNKDLRYWAVEHIMMMIVAVVLMTIGSSKAKRASGGKAHKFLFLFNLLALLVILVVLSMSGRGII